VPPAGFEPAFPPSERPQNHAWYRSASGICYHIAYLLTPWCRALLEKLIGLQLVKKFPSFYGTRRFITGLTSVRHPSLFWASPIQSIYPHPTSWRSILTLYTHPRLGLPSGLFPSGVPTKALYTPPLLTHTRHMPSPSHSSRFYHHIQKLITIYKKKIRIFDNCIWLWTAVIKECRCRI